MKLNLINPCNNCPFRTDVLPYITLERAKEIIDALFEYDQSFSCHKTTTAQGKSNRDEGAEHCAGAMILMEKMERANQWMRIGERIGLYDRRKLNMNAPVYDSPDHMIEVYENLT